MIYFARYQLKESSFMAETSNKIRIKSGTSFIDILSGIFMPICDVLSGAGLLKGLLAVLVMTSVLSENGGTYLVLNAMADTVFFFFPVFVGLTSAATFKTDKFIATALACLSLYPAINTILESGQTIRFFGIPLIGATYQSSCIPVILTVWIIGYVEKASDRIIPEIVRGFFKPIICILVGGLLELGIFGPAGTLIGNRISSCYEFLYSLSPAAAGGLLGGLVQPMVIFSLQWPLLLVSMNNIALTGSDTILAVMAAAPFGQAGASLAVFFKSRDKKFKATCISAVVSAMVGGITQPSIFAVNLPRKWPLAAGSIGGAIGGAIAGYFGSHAIAFSFPSLVTLPIYLGHGFIPLLIGCGIGFAAGFVLTVTVPYNCDIKA